MPAADTLEGPGTSRPEDIPILPNRNLQSGHPGPHALDCIDHAPVEPAHAADPPLRSTREVNRPRGRRRR